MGINSLLFFIFLICFSSCIFQISSLNFFPPSFILISFLFSIQGSRIFHSSLVSMERIHSRVHLQFVALCTRMSIGMQDC